MRGRRRTAEDCGGIPGYEELVASGAVGAEEIRLTSAGYLPPSDVVAAWAELDLGERWYGKGNREVNTLPLLLLRESAQWIGLLRKHRGTLLLLTKKGQRLRLDAVALWWHIGSHLLPRDPESFEARASLISLLGVAGAREIDSTAFKALRTDALEAIGWVLADGGPLDECLGAEGAAGAVGMLRDMGAFAAERPQGSRRTPTSGGRALARAALRDAGSNDTP